MAKKKSISRGKGGIVGAETRKQIQTLLPASFRSHLKASIREGLLAFESLFDEAVKSLEKVGEKKIRAKGKRIKVG